MAKYQIRHPQIEAVRWEPGVNIEGVVDHSGPMDRYATVELDGEEFEVYEGDYIVIVNDRPIYILWEDLLNDLYEPVEESGG